MPPTPHHLRKGPPRDPSHNHVQDRAGGEKLLPGALPFMRRALTYRFNSIIDVGAGVGMCSKELAKTVPKVVALDIRPNAERDALARESGFTSLAGDITKGVVTGGPYEAAWCNQVIEHVRDYGSFLDGIFNNLKMPGYLFITVPAHNNNVVPGHVNMGWNVGLLMHNMAVSGFITLAGALMQNNVWIIAQKHPHQDKDRGHGRWLKYYPEQLRDKAKTGFWRADIKRLNWDRPGQLEY